MKNLEQRQAILITLIEVHCSPPTTTHTPTPTPPPTYTHTQSVPLVPSVVISAAPLALCSPSRPCSTFYFRRGRLLESGSLNGNFASQFFHCDTQHVNNNHSIGHINETRMMREMRDSQPHRQTDWQRDRGQNSKTDGEIEEDRDSQTARQRIRDRQMHRLIERQGIIRK